jgi:hypothetical protein
MVQAGLKSCKNDYCPFCHEAHQCDKTCMFACAAGAPPNGGHRLLQALLGLQPWTEANEIAHGFSDSCPLGDLAARCGRGMRAPALRASLPLSLPGSDLSDTLDQFETLAEGVAHVGWTAWKASAARPATTSN